MQATGGLSLSKECDGSSRCGEVDKRDVGAAQFIVSRCDSAGFLEPSDGPFHDVAVAVGRSIEGVAAALVGA